MRCSLLTAAALGFALAGVPDSATALLPPPRVQLLESIPDEAATGDTVRVRIGADMATGTPAGLEVKMDWGNGRFGDWRPLVDPDEALEFKHVYRRAGSYRLRALVRSRNVAVGHWTRLGVIQIVGAPLDAFLTPPYLQNVGTDHITIMWEHADPLLGAVEVGQTTDYGRVIEATQIASGFDTFIFKAVLDGLTPDTQYHYRVISGRRRGDDRVFRTAPPGPATFAFGVWSDSQGENRGGGLINEYVRVDVDPLSFQASMIGFEPDGTVIGVLDRFMTRKIQVRIAEFDPDNRSMVLEWIGGVGPFQVQRNGGSRTGSWIDVGSATNQRSQSVPLVEPAAFYRVVDAR